jgi:RNA polymerase sigma factor (sigma-70 family)
MPEPSLLDLPDAELAQRAGAGDNPAFAELYRRHADAAWRLAYTVTNNRDDAADAVSDAFTRVLQALPAGRLHDNASFRSYLLTAARRAGIDCVRKRDRSHPGDFSGYQAPSSSTPTERLLDKADSAFVAAAFRGLPERWRSVLWLTEVEQIPAKEAAPLLGLSPNGVAQLAVRARNGLRERYLQAHLRDTPVPAACQYTVDHLGAYVAGALPPRDLAKVDQHLAGCETCRARESELEDLGGRLRRIVLPLPIGLGAAALKHWRSTAGLSGLSRLAPLRRVPAMAGSAEKPLAVVTAALLAAGIAGLGLINPQRTPAATPRVAAPKARSDAAAPAPAEVRFVNAAGNGTLAAEDVSRERRRAGAPGLPATQPVSIPTDRLIETPADTVDGDGDGPAPTPPPPTPAAQLQVAVSGGGTTVAAAAGRGEGSCTGASLAGTDLSCSPTTSSEHPVTVTSGGQQLPAQEIGLP